MDRESGNSSSSSASIDPRRLLDILPDAPIERAPMSRSYIAGLFAVSTLMLALPLVYVLIIIGIAYLTWLHMVNDVSIFTETRNAKAALFLYVLPIAVGVVAIISLVKPLIPIKRKNEPEIELAPHEQPVLFEYISRLCRIIGAPMPRKIVVDCNVNASASFRKGIFSFLGSDLCLTIGLPLAGGMPLKNFTGVLSHEFGHFAQGAGMRLTYVIRNINFWFARMVYERDGFDEKIDSLRRTHGELALFAILCQFIIWLSRRVLWVLMIVGHLVSSFLLRQMEYDADRYEARVAGSDAFKFTARRLQGLMVANQITLSDLQRNISENRLCDDVPRLVVSSLKRITPEIRQKLDDAINNTQTSFFDSHPCDTDRIKNAQAENAQGLFHLDAPATVLFNGFPQLCKNASFLFYQQALGNDVHQFKFVPSAEYFQDCVKDAEQFKTVRRYFQDGVDPSLPYFPNFLESPPDDNDHARLIIETRREYILQEVPRIRELIKEFDQSYSRIFTLRALRDLRNAGITIADPSHFKLPGVEDRHLNPVEQQARQRMKRVEEENTAFRDALDQRLIAGLTIAWKRKGEAEKSSPWISCLGAIETVMPRRQDLILRLTTLDILCICYRANPENHALANRMNDLRIDIERILSDVVFDLRNVPYPLAQQGDAPMLIDHILKNPPPFQTLDSCQVSSQNMLERLNNVYFHCLAMLTQLAEKAEQALGFQPLPMPPEPPAEPQEEA